MSVQGLSQSVSDERPISHQISSIVSDQQSRYTVILNLTHIVLHHCLHHEIRVVLFNSYFDRISLFMKSRGAQSLTHIQA